MDVSRKVLDAANMYLQMKEAEARASLVRDHLGAQTRAMTEREYQAYVHITGMYDIANGVPLPSPPVIHADSVPMPALTPDALRAYESAQTRAELS